MMHHAAGAGCLRPGVRAYVFPERAVEGTRNRTIAIGHLYVFVLLRGCIDNG